MLARNLNNEVVFECTRLKGTGKQGVLRPDSDGCYTLIIGALGAYNSIGQFYDYEESVKMFSKQSSFMRQIERGVLRAEWGHPKLEPNMTKEDYARRVLQIYEGNTCGTWRRITLGRERMKGINGEDVVPIYGTIFPCGPRGQNLREQLEAKGEQVCFSIRSFTNNHRDRRGVTIKKIIGIVTFDYVGDAGMSVAEKLKSPALESFSDVSYNVDNLIDIMSVNDDELGMESSTRTDIRDNLITLSSNIKNVQSNKHSFTKW